MTIQDEKVVSLTYTLTVDGEVKDQATEENPLEFIFGLGYLLHLLVPGNVIPMMNQAGGVIPGKVLEVGDAHVKMDFNHDLAGKELHFTGKVVGIRDATDKELTDGLHGERACTHDCSSCSGGCSN